MFRVTKNAAFDLQAVLLMCWINHVERNGLVAKHQAQAPSEASIVQRSRSW